MRVREIGKTGGGGERGRGGERESLTNVISSMYPLSDRFSVPPL